MMLVAVIAALAMPLHPLDVAWARLAHDVATADRAASAIDRAEIVRLDREELARWGAVPKESYRRPGSRVETYMGPTKARGERSRSAYFAIVTPDNVLDAPTFWEVTPGFSPPGEALWFLSASGCDLASGEALVGHVRFWRTSGLDRPPRYEEFKADVTSLTATRRAFPADTTVAASTSAICLSVGGIDTQPVFPTR